MRAPVAVLRCVLLAPGAYGFWQLEKVRALAAAVMAMSVLFIYLLGVFVCTKCNFGNTCKIKGLLHFRKRIFTLRSTHLKAFWSFDRADVLFIHGFSDFFQNRVNEWWAVVDEAGVELDDGGACVEFLHSIICSHDAANTDDRNTRA